MASARRKARRTSSKRSRKSRRGRASGRSPVGGSLAEVLSGQVSSTIGNRAMSRLLVDREAGAEKTSFSVGHRVPLIPQLSSMSCWAAAGAMVVGWRDNKSIDDFAIAEQAKSKPQYAKGLEANNQAALTRLGLSSLPLASYSIRELADLVDRVGPLWFASNPSSPHARVITGVFGDGTPSGTRFRINDPWPPGVGASYVRPASVVLGSVEGLASRLAPVRHPLYLAHG